MQDSPYRLIPLRNAAGDIVAEVKVDPQVFDLLNQWRWSLTTGYAARLATGGERVLMHRLILGLKRYDRRHTDHINRDRLDNRRVNLRIVTQAQNNQNRSANRGSRSGLRGAHWNERDGNWAARAQVNGRRRHLGYYPTAAEAAAVAAEWRAEHMTHSED